VFSNDHALYAVNFIESLKHVKSPFHGKPFELLPWQHQFISDVYGTLNEKGFRQYQYCYLEIPKKNGKSELGAAIAMYHLLMDGEMYGEVYGCAADRANAAQVFDVAVGMIEQSPYLKKRCKIVQSQKTIIDKATHSFYKVCSAEAYSKHGLNVSCVIFDELHTQPNRDLWDVMTAYSGDAREQPLWYVITTAGDDPDRNTIGWEIHEKAQKIIAGEITEPRWYCKIWGIEPDFESDIWDEKLWYKVNPSLGYTIDIEKVRQAALSARNSEAEERNFRWLRLNQWVANKTTSWLPLSLWDAHAEEIPKEKLLDKRCYVGIDLSSVGDLTGICVLFPPQDDLETYYVIFDGFIPLENMKEREIKDGIAYGKFLKSGEVHATPGNVIDYDFIKAKLIEINELYDVQAWGNDPWGAVKLAQDLMRDADIELMEVRQNISNMSPSMKEIERLLRLGVLKHEKNKLARWCFGNVKCVSDGNENYKPQKQKHNSNQRIDLIVALINAMYICMKNEGTESVYRTRGIITA
jgi:phage terminase large subunit-like protein